MITEWMNNLHNNIDKNDVQMDSKLMTATSTGYSHLIGQKNEWQSPASCLVLT